MIQKPTSVLRKEFISKMVTLINESGLPFFVIEPILKDLHEHVSAESERLYQMEKAQYEASLKVQEESEEG